MLVSYPCSLLIWMALAFAMDWDSINNWVFGTWEQALTCAGGLGRSRTSSLRACKISSSHPVIQTLCFGRIYCSFLSFFSLHFFFHSSKMFLKHFDLVLSFRMVHVFYFHSIRTEWTESSLLLNKNLSRLHWDQPHRSRGLSIRYGLWSGGM